MVESEPTLFFIFVYYLAPIANSRCSLAYAEMRLILARIVFNFDMRLADPNDNWLDQKVYMLWDKPDLNVILTPVQ